MFKIHTLNKISSNGLNELGDAYQIVDQIETESHDVNPQFVITESQIYYKKKE